MGNLDLYNKLKVVPAEAIKPIQNGRLKGKSDINPMWRIKTMTEHFGVCGIGWKYVITKQWTETFGTETKAYCNIDLFVKVDGQWSDAIQGTGGSSEVTMERNGSYVSDECYKMAYRGIVISSRDTSPSMLNNTPAIRAYYISKEKKNGKIVITHCLQYVLKGNMGTYIVTTKCLNAAYIKYGIAYMEGVLKGFILLSEDE
jgi:hypothetical protein